MDSRLRGMTDDAPLTLPFQSGRSERNTQHTNDEFLRRPRLPSFPRTRESSQPPPLSPFRHTPTPPIHATPL